MRRVAPTRGLRKVRQRHRVEIVVGERDEPESSSSQLHRLVDHVTDGCLPRSLAVGAPYRAERAMLGASAYRLDRCPHIAVFRQEIPAGRLELPAGDSSCFVNQTGSSCGALVDDGRPDDIAVPADNGVCAAERVGLGREERRVNTAKNNVRAARTRQLSDFVAA